jgi:hypothetical protein
MDPQPDDVFDAFEGKLLRKQLTAPKKLHPELHSEPFEDVDNGIWELARDMGMELTMDQAGYFRESAKLRVLERMAEKWVVECMFPPSNGDKEEEEEAG